MDEKSVKGRNTRKSTNNPHSKMNKKYKKLLELQEMSVLRKLSRKEVKRPTVVRKLAFFAKQLKSFLEKKTRPVSDPSLLSPMHRH